MKVSNRTLWVLLCVIVVLVLVLAALLISRYRGKDVAAAALGGAARLGGRRPREKIGGAVGDIWTIPRSGAESVSTTDFNLGVGGVGTFFPAFQTAAHPTLVADWTAIRAAYNTLDQDMAAAYAADPSWGVTKGAVRMLAPGGGMAGRSIGTWQNAYVSLDNALVGLGRLVDTYKIDPPHDATPARFNGLKAGLLVGLPGQPPGAGPLADLRGRMLPTAPTQGQVQASINALALLVNALPAPAVFAPLPPSAAGIAALAAGNVTARGHSAAAETSVITLRDAYVGVRNAWAVKRVAMPAGSMPTVTDRDARLTTCDRLVDAIITQFTAALSTDLVAAQCERDQAALVSEIALLSAGAWNRGEKRLLAAFTTAANGLAFCLPPPPAPSAKTIAYAPGGANENDASSVGGHNWADNSAVTEVFNTYVALTAWWRAWAARESQASYPGGLPAALRAGQQLASMSAHVDSLIDAFIVPSVPGTGGWPAAAADQCAQALLALNAAYIRFNANVALPPGFFGGLFGATTAWDAFRDAVNAAPQIRLPDLVIPPLLNPRTLATLPGLVYQHPPPTVKGIQDLAVEYNRFYRMYGIAGAPTVRERVRNTGNSSRVEPVLDQATASLVALVTLYANPKTDTSPADSVAAIATALADVTTLAGVLSPRPGSGLADRLVAQLGRIPPIIQLPYEGATISKPLTASQRLIHLTATPDVEAHFSKEVAPTARGVLVLEVASESELDAKLARAPDVAARLYGLVVDQPGDLVALYKAVAINIGTLTPADIKSKRADVARAATGWLYTATRLPTGGYFKQFRDYVKPALYDVA